MRRGDNVSFTHHAEIVVGDEVEEVEVSVCARVSDSRPGTGQTLTGPGTPPEPAEVEEIEVWLPDGNRLFPIPDFLCEQLCTRAIEVHHGS